MAENRLAPWMFQAARGDLNNVIVNSVNASTPSLASGITSDIWQNGGILLQQSTAQRIRIVSSSANDGAGGSGARQVEVRGLDANFDIQDELVNLNGTTPVFTVGTYRRHFRTSVIEAGTFATTIVSSLAGTLALEWENTTDLVATIPPTVAGLSQASTRLTHITIPRDFTGQIFSLNFFVDGTKPATAALMFRINSDEAIAPFGSVQIAVKLEAFSGAVTLDLPIPFTFPETTDIWVAATPGSNSTVIEAGYGVVGIRNNT